MFSRLRDWLRGGPETVRRNRRLRDEPLPAGSGDRPEAGAVTAAQAGVMVAVGSTLAVSDRRHAGRLTAAQQELIAAAQKNLETWQRLQTAADGSPASRHAATVGRPPEASPTAPEPVPGHPSGPAGGPAADPVLRRDFDPHLHLISLRKLMAMELILLLVEVVFWYGVFTERIDRNSATVLDWVPPVLLAVFLPLAGIAAARIAGQLGHRLVAGYPGVGPREWIGTVVALLTLLAAGYATYWLVHLRFADTPLGGLALPPGFMATIFVVVLAADAVARMFLRSELHEQRTGRVRALDRLAAEAIAANAAHQHAWVRLRARVQVQLDRCEQVAGAGAGLIADALAARSTGGPVWLTVGPDRPAHRPDRPAHRPEPGGRQPPAGAAEAAPPAVEAAPLAAEAAPLAAEAAPLAVPDPDQLHLLGVPLAPVPLRLVSDAINSLDHWRPLTAAAIAAELADLRRRWFGTDEQPAPGRPARAPSGLLDTMSQGGQRTGAPVERRPINHHPYRAGDPAPAAAPDAGPDAAPDGES